MAKKIDRWKLILNIVTVLALVVLVYATRKQVAEAFANFADLKASLLLLVIPLQLVNYLCAAKLYQAFYKVQDENVPLREMYKAGLELNFVNTVFPSGGVSGFSYLGLRMKRFGISGAKSTLAQLMRFAMTFVSFLILMFVGMFLLSISRGTSALIILVCSTVTFMVLFGIVGVGFIISRESRIRAFTSFLPKVLNRALRPFRRHKTDTIDISRIERGFTDLHHNFVKLKGKWPQLKQPLLWGIGVNLSEISSIYVVYMAFGEYINPGALIIGYAAANFAGIVAVLPGGVGVYEGLMTGVMASAGIPQALALSATVVYRVVNMGIFLPIGYILYQKALRGDKLLAVRNE